jgi:16S rRNA (adenine1518-N6/adenine1519-N6)-dimethyltransferase
VRGPSRPRARKRFGQHFLEPAWVTRLVGLIAPAPDDTFLEIGPGRGAITRQLASRARRVVAIEIDRDLARGLAAESIRNLTVVQGDFLEIALDALTLPRGTRVAGNLPYNVSTPIIFRLLDLSAPLGLGDATVMVQKEVADRLAAAPGSRDYGPLSIFVALACTVTRLLTLPPGAFRPAPKVTSAVVRLTFPAEPRRPVVPAAFGPLVRSIFTMRRKTLVNAVRRVAEAKGWRPAGLLEQAGLDPRRRPETLGLPELLDLAHLLTRSGAAEGRR